ncbi:MAG: tetratricopeptide repeat protein [Kiloniellales bacterium]|nr:tetratricopeptide repeat protein [Kiloniellales bacterium]
MLGLSLSSVPVAAETVADGIAAYRQGDYQRARTIWRGLAEAGDAVAQFNLGKLYEYGGGEVRQDYVEAARWYRAAADQGVAAAQNNLGLMHSQGLGVARNPRRAAELWKRAAEDDYSLAQYNLALAYFRGEGVVRDERLAALWFEKAAQAGLPDSQYAMGQLLRLGRVADRDEGQALSWYKMAAAQGHAGAQQQVQSLEAKGVVAKTPVPLTPPPGVAAAPAEPSAEATAEPPREPAGESETAAGRQPADSPGAGVAADVPVPEPKPDPPAAAPEPEEEESAPQQTAAVPPAGEAGEEGPEAALPEVGDERGSESRREYRLWLVSADSAVAAEDLRQETLARHREALSDVEVGIYEMDYGERGHFYRILAGPLYSADAANDLCRRLRQDNPDEFCKVLTR